MLTGEPGIGKTCLLRALRKELPDKISLHPRAQTSTNAPPTWTTAMPTPLAPTLMGGSPVPATVDTREMAQPVPSSAAQRMSLSPRTFTDPVPPAVPMPLGTTLRGAIPNVYSIALA